MGIIIMMTKRLACRGEILLQCRCRGEILPQCMLLDAKCFPSNRQHCGGYAESPTCLPTREHERTSNHRPSRQMVTPLSFRRPPRACFALRRGIPIFSRLYLAIVRSIICGARRAASDRVVLRLLNKLSGCRCVISDELMLPCSDFIVV